MSTTSRPGTSLIARLATSVHDLGYEPHIEQPSLLPSNGDEPQPVAALHATDRRHNGHPHVLVFRGTPDSAPSADGLASARAVAARRHADFLTFTKNGADFATYLVRTDGSGSLPFVPPAVVDPSRAFRIVDLRPVISLVELRHVVSFLSDTIFASHGHDRLKLFDTILSLLAAKIHDELRHPDDLVLNRWLSESDPLSTRVRKYVRTALAEMGCEQFARLIDLDLAEEPLRQVLGHLCRYSLRSTIDLDTHAEILGTFYQDAVSSTFRGSLGAYFTPKPVADLAVALAGPTAEDTVFDISCGSATFLLSAFLHATARDRTRGPVLFGNDIQERMVATSVLNCALHGAPEAHFIQGDGLRVDLQAWRQTTAAVPRGGFSLVVGNPPFAGFENWISPDASSRNGAQRGAGTRVHKIIPFVEKVARLLAPGGRAVLVIPTSVLNGEAGAYQALREHLSKTVHVTALINLPAEAFVHTDCGVAGALIMFTRPVRSISSRARTFYWALSDIGYDRRGSPTGRSEIPALLAAWRGPHSRIPTRDLYSLSRWDVPWVQAAAMGTLAFSKQTHVRLTDLCQVESRQFSRRDLVPDDNYRFFEVGDTDIDDGTISLRSAKGVHLAKKGRLRLRVRKGDVLLPNHRDSLIAKSAASIGRSAVLVTAEADGAITTDRFTPLVSQVNPLLLIALLNSKLVRHQLALHARGSASFDIRDKVLREVMVPRAIIDDAGLLRRARRLFRDRDRLRGHLARAQSGIDTLIDDAAPAISREGTSSPS